MNTIGVGLIGTGFMGKCQALAFNSVKAAFGDVPTPRLEVLCDLDPQVAEQRAEAFGFARWTGEWRSLVADPSVDLVAIATPNALHRDMTLAAIAQGKHVYCEKPMALTLGDAETMAEAAASAGVMTLVGYNYLKNPAVLHAKDLIAKGAIGDVVHFRGAYDEDYMADPQHPFSWRCRIAEAGPGTLGDLSCHLISVAHFLLGEIAMVAADVRTVHRHRPLSETGNDGLGEVENDDLANALIRFRSGVTGAIASSRIAWGRKNHLAWEVHGSKGMLVFSQERMNELKLFRAQGDRATQGFTTILTGPAHFPYDRFVPAPGHGLGFNEMKTIEVAHLLNGLAGREPLYPSFVEALAIERVIHAMLDSARTGAWVDVQAGRT